MAYVRAITAQAGLNIKSPEWDDGIDLEIGSTKPASNNIKHRNIWISLQLKSSACWKLKNGHIHYFLKKSNYDQLRAESMSDQFLVLYTLPRDPGRFSWITQEPDHAAFRSRAFYLSLQDMPDIKSKSNGRERSGKTIKIPIENRLTAASLRNIYLKSVSKWTKFLNSNSKHE